MPNTKNLLQNNFVGSIIKLWKNFKKVEKMMFPVRSDAPEECQPVGVYKSTTSACKSLRTVFIISGVLFLIIVFNAMSPAVQEEPPEEDKISSSACKEELGEKMKSEIKALIQKEIQTSAKMCSKGSRISPEQMRNIVREELKRQQKNQLKPDFASASAGGVVIEASPTWTEGYSYIYFLFIPIRSTAPTASIVLEPTRQPGDCWPMVGCKGSLLIQLAARANIVGFTIEHIDPAMSLSGGTPEAPNNFTVYGLEDIDDMSKKHNFGSYFYNNKIEEESQYFRVLNANRKSFMYVLLEITSNHGNEKYTCLYRFQVHGFIDRAYHCR